MKKSSIFLILLLPSFLFAALTPGPVSGSNAKDVAEPSQKQQNYKMWRNLLGSYASFRKIAWATLHDLNMVSSVAWTAQSTLQNLETFSNNISQIYKNIQNLSNVNDVINLIEDVEVKVFQQTDPIVLGGLPELQTTMKQNVELRDKFLKDGSSTWKALKEFRDDTQKRYFAAKYKAAMSKTASLMEKDDSSNSAVRAQALQMSISSRALSSQDEFNMKNDDQAAMIAENSKRSKENEKNNSVMQASIEDRINQRNSYIVGLQYHGQLKDNIDQEGMYLMSKTKVLDKYVYEMSLANSSAELFRSIAHDEAAKGKK